MCNGEVQLPADLPWIIVGCAALLALVQTLRLAGLRAAPGIRLRASALRGAVGERSAAGLLSRAGYAIEATQASAQFAIAVDGLDVDVEVRADYLVSRAGRSFVAEVKTGAIAPSVDHAPTRRQLLEYSHAFGVDGVLLVDGETGSVREIEFPWRKPPTRGLRWLLVGAVLGAVAAASATAAVLRHDAPAKPHVTRLRPAP